MSTAKSANKLFPRIFKGPLKCAGHPKSRMLYHLIGLTSGWTDSKALQVLKRKDNSFQDPSRRLRVHLRYRKYPHLSKGILTFFPFGLLRFSDAIKQKIIRQWITELPTTLGPTYPCSTNVHMEPFSTSVFKVLIWINTTTTGICTGVNFTQDYSLGFYINPTPSYSLTLLVH